MTIASTYAADGYVVVPGVFDAARMDAAIADAREWAQAFLASLPEDKRGWYVDGGAAEANAIRKLDNPHHVRPLFRALAREPGLVALVEELAGGTGVSVYFSQIFFKPPRGGGPKPAHQDNYYFGPTDHDGVVTAWIALEDADEANGCLRYGVGTHKGPILAHAAPPYRPFDLQLSEADLARLEMRPAPVPKGGVAFHHGGTVHRSADNRSDRWRRACAFHYVRNDVTFANPALPYDHGLVFKVS
jgi:ectoine hydroxylase-related dioxygenase (phytanoyl-CoA dioxygenase family)